jgi:hypothetical protein
MPHVTPRVFRLQEFCEGLDQRSVFSPIRSSQETLDNFQLKNLAFVLLPVFNHLDSLPDDVNVAACGGRSAHELVLKRDAFSIIPASP